MKRNLKKILVQIVAVICIVSCLCVSASAYSTTTSGTTTISPTNDQFKSAKNPMYASTSHNISDSISSSYEMDIIHYEAQNTGYYAVYTTGNTDTVGKVFEQQNVLFWTSDYVDKGLNDDGGVGLNYRHVLELDKYEDYYICTRAYGTKTGSYNLIIEPNDDARESNIGGQWVSDTASYGTLATTGGYEIFTKTYLTAEQVKTYYQMLVHEAIGNLIKNSYTRNGVVGTIQELVNNGFSVLNLFTTFDSFSPEPIVGPAVSLGISLSEGVAGAIFDSFYEETDSIADTLAALETYGGAGSTPDYSNNTDTYYASHGVCITYRGYASNGYTDFSNLYSTYDSTELVGVDYEKGHWE